MRFASITAVLAISLAASAGEHPAKDYQDGVLRAVKWIAVGSSCSESADTNGTITGNTVQATTTGSGSCYTIKRAIYTVEVAGTAYELTPEHSAAAKATILFPMSAAFLKHSSLANRLAGTPVKVRSATGGIFVLVDKRETRYSIFEVH